MYRLVRFFKRYYAVFLFVLLEAGAISYYANSTSYTRATLLAGAARVTGGIEGFFASAGDYFSLRRENAVLLERLAEAETRLHAAIPADDTLAARTDGMKYLFGTAKVVSNSIARQDNFFVIDKGTADGIEENMAVLSPEGAVAGYVRRHSDHYAVCMSVLNGSFSIGGRLKGSEYFGSVYWDGTDPREMTMVDIPVTRMSNGRHGTVGLFTAVPARLFHRYGSLRERIAGRNIPCDKDTARREDERTVRRAAREIHRLRRARNPRGRTLLRCRQKKK